MRSVARTSCIALCLAGLTAAPAHAGLITDVTKMWTASGCFTKGWPWATPPSSSSTDCITGNIEFGYSASLAAYGYTFDFTYTNSGSPAGTSLTVSIDCLEFSETPVAFGHCPDEMVGPQYISSGQFFNPPLAYPGPGFDANSSLLQIQGEYQWLDGTAPPECLCNEQIGDLVLTPVLTPEPATLALVGSGLPFLMLWGFKRRSTGWFRRPVTKSSPCLNQP